MLIIFYMLLMLRVGRCTDDQIFETKTTGVGSDVKLTCTRKDTGSIFWIRLVSGNLPEVLGKTFSLDGVDPRITSKEEPGSFDLHITKAKLSDAGVYFCMKILKQNFTFLKGTDLRVEEPEPDITSITQDSPSDPVPPGDSVTLQCSVLSDSEKKTCPAEHIVYWFRAGSDGSHPSLIHAHGNSDDCEKSLESRSPQKCVYSFSKNVSSFDAGTYYCAVATCGEIFGNGTKVDNEAVNTWDSTVMLPLCAALAISLIVIFFLIYTVKKKTCGCCNAAVDLQTATASGDQQSQQRGEDSLTYSAPTFTKRKTGRAERRNVKTGEGETIYSDIRVFVTD